MTDPGVYHDNMHPPGVGEQDAWCPTHPHMPYVIEEHRKALARAESVEAEVGTLVDTLALAHGPHTQLRGERDVAGEGGRGEAKRDEFADLLARALPAVAAPGLAWRRRQQPRPRRHPGRCSRPALATLLMRDLRAALANGEGQ